MKNHHQDEELRILNAAAKCIRDSSLLDFKMSAIAKEAGISVGSVYKHVRSKEDVLVALAIRMAIHSHKVLLNILNLPLSAPERLISAALVDPTKIHAEPFAVHLEMMLSNQAMLQRASPHRLQELARLDHAMEQLFIDAMQADSELNATGAKRAALIEELMIGLWSLHVGFIQVAYHRAARHSDTLSSPLPFPLPIKHAFVNNTAHLINIYPWQKPLTNPGIKKAAAQLETLGYR